MNAFALGIKLFISAAKTKAGECLRRKAAQNSANELERRNLEKASRMHDDTYRF